ncbi:TolC family protein [Geobacter sp. DSM 9736]|uniref:TolC family protein n=1 Tax=Geobacter sp. DSM 9736 TaxID=1277350 RepID=UPI000B503C6A|nr:TolC family protein [Geobacter sp. DSM 9736]SNB45397.1 Outer membrane protein TolC [Geobacter sp. DSM 9736]
MKRIVLALLVCGLWISQGARAEEPENLQRLVETALSNNPEIKASSARWEMFRNRIAQAKSFDDPMLMLKIQNGLVKDPLSFRRDPMTQKVIGISQQLPFWGKRALRSEVAAKEAESYQWQIEERKLELARMVKESWYQLWFVEKELDIVDKNIKILDDFIALAETKYSVGQGVQQDVLKAQVERSKMLDMRITLEQQRKSVQAAMNALLYRSGESSFGKIEDFTPRKVSSSVDTLRATAKENRPLLKSLKAEIDKGSAGHKLAEKEYYPDFNISLEYMQRDRIDEMEVGDDMYSLGVTFNLPVQRARRQAMIAESSSEIRMATEELNSQNNTINQGITDLLAQLERRDKLIALYRTGILPQAEQALESAVISYRVGKVDFLTLLDSRVTLFNYEREYYDSLADYEMKRAQLEALVGRELP